LNERINNVACT